MAPLVWLALTARFLSFGCARAQDYTQMETPTAFVLMDQRGIAVKFAKNWACRNANWSSLAEPVLLKSQLELERFQSEHRAAGDWEAWACRAKAGELLYSRDVHDAQRAMNSAADRPACAPMVPETGLYNWQMVDYSRCALEAKATSDRTDYKIDVVRALAALLRAEVPEGFTPMEADEYFKDYCRRAASTPIREPVEACGRRAANLLDFALCKEARRDEYLTRAERALETYEEHARAVEGSASIPQTTMQALAAEEAAVRRLLGLAEWEARGR